LKTPDLQGTEWFLKSDIVQSLTVLNTLSDPVMFPRPSLQNGAVPEPAGVYRPDSGRPETAIGGSLN
jgi:hypothetical protein